MKTKYFPLIPTMASDSFLEGNKENMEEIGNVSKLGKISRREPAWALFRCLSRGNIWKKHILEVLEMPGTSQKQKWIATTLIKQT